MGGGSHRDSEIKGNNELHFGGSNGGLRNSVVNPDPYWIRIKELSGSNRYSEYGFGSTHVNIG